MLNLLSGRFGRRADIRANLLIARFSASAVIGDRSYLGLVSRRLPTLQVQSTRITTFASNVGRHRPLAEYRSRRTDEMTRRRLPVERRLTKGRATVGVTQCQR